MEQILAEGATLDGFFEVAMSRRNDPYVAAHGCLVANALEDALLQHTQQLHLHGGAHVADLIEKQRTAFSDLEPALARRDGAGEGAPLVSEQLGFEQIGGDRTAVDGHERPAATRAQVVNGASADFLAGAGFPEHEHGRVVARNLPDQRDDVPDQDGGACGKACAAIIQDGNTRKPGICLAP